MGFRSFERGDRDSDSRSGGRSFGGSRGGGRDFGGGGRSFGGSRGGFGGGRGGFDGGRRDRRDMAPCDAVCAKCGKNCQVPFKPTGDRPVYCSACFGAGAGAERDNSRSEKPSFGGNASAQSGITKEQFQQLSKKVDKILELLESLEIIDDEDAEGEDNAEAEEVVEEPAEKSE